MRLEIKWGWFYFAVVVLFALVVLPVVLEISRLDTVSEWLTLKDIPSLKAEEIMSELDSLKGEFQKPASDDPQEYFKLQGRARRAELLLQKYEDRREREKDPRMVVILRIRTSALRSSHLEELKQKYDKRYPEEAMQKASLAYFGAGNPKPGEHNGPDYGSLWPILRLAYFQSLPLALVFFLLRLRGKGLKIPIETWRMALATIGWPISIFLYPSKIDPRKQLIAALRFASFVITTVLSFGSMGGIAKAQTGAGGKRRNTDSSAQIAKTTGSLNVEVLPFTPNGFAGDMVEPNYT